MQIHEITEPLQPTSFQGILLYAYRHRHRHTHSQTKTHSQANTHTHTHMHAHTHIHAHTHAGKHAHTHARTHTHTHTHTRAHTYQTISTFKIMLESPSICIQTQTQTDTHAYTHTRIHTHTHTRRWGLNIQHHPRTSCSYVRCGRREDLQSADGIWYVCVFWFDVWRENLQSADRNKNPKKTNPILLV